jgi:hypothetical protein
LAGVIELVLSPTQTPALDAALTTEILSADTCMGLSRHG